MNDKNKFTIKIILVILLGIALLATLISCCVVATKGNMKSKAKATNAPLQSNEVLSDIATASSLETDYISISQANTDDTYYGIYVPDNEANKNAILNDKTTAVSLFTFTLDNNYNFYGYSYINGNRTVYLSYGSDTSKKIYMYLLNRTYFSNEYRCDNGFSFISITDKGRLLDIYVRTTPYTSGGDVSALQAQIAALTAEKATLQAQIDDLTAEKTALQAQITEKQNQIDTLTAEKATLQSQVNDLTADKTALQAQITEKQNQIDTLTAEKATLQSQVNDLTADKTALQAQITEKQNQIDSLTAEISALQRENNLLREQIESESFCMKFYYCYTDDSGTLHGSKPQTLIGNNHSGYFDTKKLFGYVPAGMKPFYDFTEGMLRIIPSQDGSLTTIDTPVYFKGFADFVYRSKLQYEKDNYVTKYIFSNDDKTNYIVFWVENYGLDWQNDAILKDNAYHIGYQNGLNDAEQSGKIFESSTGFIKSTFTDLGKLLDIKIFGNITVGTIIGIPLVLIVVLAVLKLVRG